MATTAPGRIEEEINKYTLLLSDPRAEKNSFLPIFRLPPETLACVFTHGARDYHEGNDHLTFRVPQWVNVSYICRHWRSVALNCPTLWTYHFTVSQRWTKELLARSKQASLKIHVNYGYRGGILWWSRLVKKLLNHAERIQELRLNILGDILPTELTLNAPRLQILDIHFQDCSSERTFVVNNGDTLPLRTLKLSDCPLPWHSSLNLSRVTTLFLCRVPCPSLKEFLATLSRMQALAVLHLDRTLADSRSFLSSEAFCVSPRVKLPCLTRLFIRALLSTVVALLSCMDVPLKTQLRLEIQSEANSSADDYDQLPSLLAQRFSRTKDPLSSSPAIRSLVISSLVHERRFTISASEHGNCDSHLSKMHPPQDCNVHLMIIVSLGRPMVIRNMEDLISDICCSIPSTHVQTLHLSNSPFSHNFWKKTLGHFDGLRYMKLSDGDMPDLVSLLALPADGPGDATNDHDLTLGHAFVPALEELKLDCITFSSEDDFSDGAVSKQSLLDALTTRKALRLNVIEYDVKVGDELCQCRVCRLEEFE